MVWLSTNIALRKTVPLRLKQNEFEPQHDKTNKMSVRPAKTQISLGIRPVWSESSLSAWRNLGPLATHWAYSEDSDQVGRMPRLIWVFAGRTLILLVLSCRGSFCSFVDYQLWLSAEMFKLSVSWIAGWCIKFLESPGTFGFREMMFKLSWVACNIWLSPDDV